MRLFLILLLSFCTVHSYAITSRMHLKRLQQAKHGPLADERHKASEESQHHANSRMQESMTESGQNFESQDRQSARAIPRQHSELENTQVVPYDAAPKFDPDGRDFFTVQLLGSRDKFGLELYLRNSGLHDKAVIVSERRDNGIWYVALLGRYENKAEAVRAIAGLPKNLRDHSPWVRRRSELQFSELAPNPEPSAEFASLPPPKSDNKVRFKPVMKRRAFGLGSRPRVVADNTDSVQNKHQMLPPPVSRNKAKPQVALKAEPDEQERFSLARQEAQKAKLDDADDGTSAMMEIETTA